MKESDALISNAFIEDSNSREHHPENTLVESPFIPSNSISQVVHNQHVLPLDLLDIIIDYLHDDCSSLCTVALVSRQALCRSRSYLVSKVIFTPDTRGLSEEGLYRADGLDSLFPILDVPWTSFSDFLKELSLFGHSWNRPSDQSVFSSLTPPPFGSSSVAVLTEAGPVSGYGYHRIAANLKSLKKLSVNFATWYSIPDKIQQLFSLCDIEELRMDECLVYRTSSIEYLLEWIRSSSIKRLSMHNATLLSPESHISEPLRHLHFSTCDDVTLQSFLEQGVIPLTDREDCEVQIEELDLHILRSYESELQEMLPQCALLLRRFGASVTKLALLIDSDEFLNQMPVDVTENNKELLLLDNCPNIEALHIGNLSLRVQSSFQQIVYIIQDLLLLLPKDKLKRIYLTFYPGGLDDIAAFPWEDVVVHSRKHCGSLSGIFIRFCTEQLDKAYLEALRQAGLQRFEDEGLVSLEIYNWASNRTPKPSLYMTIMPHSLNFFD